MWMAHAESGGNHQRRFVLIIFLAIQTQNIDRISSAKFLHFEFKQNFLLAALFSKFQIQISTSCCFCVSLLLLFFCYTITQSGRLAFFIINFDSPPFLRSNYPERSEENLASYTQLPHSQSVNSSSGWLLIVQTSIYSQQFCSARLFPFLCTAQIISTLTHC